MDRNENSNRIIFVGDFNSPLSITDLIDIKPARIYKN